MLLLENIKDLKSVSFHLKKLEKKNKLNTKKQKKRNNKDQSRNKWNRKQSPLRILMKSNPGSLR